MIQVHDDAVPQDPPLNIPQPPDHTFDCATIGELVEVAVRTGVRISPTARQHWVDYHGQRTLFSTAVFREDNENEEVANMHHDMRRGQFLAKPNGRGRVWGQKFIEATQTLDITDLIAITQERLVASD